MYLGYIIKKGGKKPQKQMKYIIQLNKYINWNFLNVT